MKMFEYLPESLLIPVQAWGFVGFIWEYLKDFCNRDFNRIRVGVAQRRFAPKLDAPAFFIEFNEISPEQEDYAVYNFFPIGTFVGQEIPERIEANMRVILKVYDKEINVLLEGCKWETWPVWENLPIPFFALKTGFQKVGYIAGSFQRITATWTVNYLGKVLDIYDNSLHFSVSSLLGVCKKFFPSKVFVPIAVKEFPLPNKERVILTPSTMFWASLEGHVIEDIYVEEERRLLCKLTFTTRQTVLCGFHLSQRKYLIFDSFKENSKLRENFSSYKEIDP